MNNVNVAFADEIVFFSVEGFPFRMEVTFRELRSSAKTCTAMYEDAFGVVSHYTLSNQQAKELYKVIDRPA